MIEWISNLTVGEAVSLVLAGFFTICTVLEKIPEAISPWTRLFDWLGARLNREVLERLETVEKNVKDNAGALEQFRVIEARGRIIRFGDELLHNVRHSKDHFDHILLDITEYEQYCEVHKDFKNHITDMTVQQIKDSYQKRILHQDFL